MIGEVLRWGVALTLVFWGLIGTLIGISVQVAAPSLISTTQSVRFDPFTYVSHPLNQKTGPRNSTAFSSTDGSYDLIVIQDGGPLQFLLQVNAVDRLMVVETTQNYVSVEPPFWLPTGDELFQIAVAEDGQNFFRTYLVAVDLAASHLRIESIADLTAQVGSVFIAAYSPDGSRVVLWSGRQTLYVWDIEQGEITGERRVPDIGDVHWIDRQTVLYQLDNCLWTLDADTMEAQEIGCPTERLSATYALWNTSPSPDGRWLALVWDETLPAARQNPLELRQGVGLYGLDERILYRITAFEDVGGIYNTDLLQWSGDSRYLLAGFDTFFPREGAYLIDTVSLTWRMLPGRFHDATWENLD
jgi:hypothetical protein